MTDFDWTLVPANMDYYRRSEVDKLIERAQKEYAKLFSRIKNLEDESEYLSLQKLLNWKAKEDARGLIAKADNLMIKHYPCYSETNCKKCVGDWDKIHYETCAGYNVIRALRGEEVSGNV